MPIPNIKRALSIVQVLAKFAFYGAGCARCSKVMCQVCGVHVDDLSIFAVAKTHKTVDEWSTLRRTKFPSNTVTINLKDYIEACFVSPGRPMIEEQSSPRHLVVARFKLKVNIFLATLAP